MGAWEPDLLQPGDSIARQALPERGQKVVARLVESEGLEGVLDAGRDVGVGKLPRGPVSGVSWEQPAKKRGDLLLRAAVEADQGDSRDAEAADGVPDGDSLDGDIGAVGLGVAGVVVLGELVGREGDKGK